MPRPGYGEPVEGVLQEGDWIETGESGTLFLILGTSKDQDGRTVLTLGGEGARVVWKHEQTLHRWGVSLAEPPMALQFEMEIEEPS